MKRILLATNILLLVIIFFLACAHKFEPASFQTGNLRCADTTCYSYNPDDMTGVITYDLARQMSQAYAADAGKKYIWYGESQSNVLDATSIWFDLRKLKNFIGFIEHAACSNGCSANDIFGIRMYYIKYPDSSHMNLYHELDGVPREFADHHALMLCPTKWDGTRHIDFDPATIGANCNIKNPIAAPHIYLLTGGSDQQNDLQNHGSLMPPPANMGTFPTTGE